MITILFVTIETSSASFFHLRRNGDRMDKPQANTEPLVSKAFHPLAIGNPGDKRPTPEQVATVLSILTDAGIFCVLSMNMRLSITGLVE